MKISRMLWAAVVAISLATSFGYGLEARFDGFQDWPTRPSQLRQLSFVQPGRIAATLVEEGADVKAGDSLVQLDDAREQKELAVLQLLAEDKTKIDYAEAALGQAIVDEKILLDAEKQEPGSSTTSELQHARLEVKLKEASRDMSVLEHKQAVAEYEIKKVVLERMLLTAPMDGRVERIFLKEGESADALEKVIVLVQLDPLWVDMPVPVDKARTLKLGQAAEVRYVNLEPAGAEAAQVDAEDTVIGKVVYKSSLVDSTNRLTVRVEIPNLHKRPAGEHVRVDFDVPAARKAPAAPKAPAKAARADKAETPKK